jgi:hypothetical protein
LGLPFCCAEARAGWQHTARGGLIDVLFLLRCLRLIVNGTNPCFQW